MRPTDIRIEPRHLKDYLLVVRRNIWLVLAVFIVVLGVRVLQLQRQVPIYQAQASLVVEPEQKQDYLSPAGAVLVGMDLETQMELIKMPPVLGQVVRELGLSTAPPDSPEFDAAVKALDDSIHLGLHQNTKIINITAQHANPEPARDIANAVAQAYIDQDRLSRLHAGRDAVRWLSIQLADIKTKLQRAEQAFQTFKEREKIISLDEKQSAETQEITKLNASYISARIRRLELETTLEQLGRSDESADIPDSPRAQTWSLRSGTIGVLNSPSLQQLGTELVRLQTELDEKRKIFTETYPDIIELKSKIELTRQNIIAEMEEQYQASKAQEQSLLAELDQKRTRAVQLGQKEMEYLALEREVTTNREMYNTLLMRVKELSLVEGKEGLNHIRIVASAKLPTLPIGNKLRALIYGALLGLALGVGAAFFLDYFQTNIQTPDDVARHLDQKVLGLIPGVKDAQKSRTPTILVAADNRDAAADAYRSLRSTLFFYCRDNGNIQSLLVTSTGPSEGKSLTILNLGLAMAYAGMKVILVDADLRKPILHRVFGVAKAEGLSAVLENKIPLEAAILETSLPNLNLLTAGAVPPNPSELLGSTEMQMALQDLREKYDMVLLDSAPVLGMPDVATLAPHIDATLLIIKAGKVAKKPAQIALQQLEQIDATPLGVVLNDINFRKGRYYDYYYYYYYSDYSADGDRRGRRRKNKRKPRSSQIAEKPRIVAKPAAISGEQRDAEGNTREAAPSTDS